jgi:hypothetical protein
MSTPSVEIDSTTYYVFISLADAETYFKAKLFVDSWDDATAVQKNKALVMATRRISQLNFSGSKADADQPLPFPRGDDTTIPDGIANGTCEAAFSLLDGIDPELEFENLGLESVGVSSARATYDRSLTPEHILVGIPSAAAWTLIRPYLRDPREIKLSRT